MFDKTGTAPTDFELTRARDARLVNCGAGLARPSDRHQAHQHAMGCKFVGLTGSVSLNRPSGHRRL